MKGVIRLLSGFSLLSALCFFSSQTTQAQVTSANDSLGSQVTQTGNLYEILGGTYSSDGHNLFHSLGEMSLDANEITRFFSNPSTSNILTRIVGGNPSIIDGLLEVSGSNANLFLMNPSGFVFGSNVGLNIPGSLVTTTATGIQFDDGWFDAYGDFDYSSLVGDPTAFRFDHLNPGSIVNSGTLSVPEGETISLSGGTVINTGTLEAPGGNISITAVPGSSMVELRQPGQVVGLVVDLPTDEQGNFTSIDPLSLGDLLTVGGLQNIGLEVDDNGVVTTDQDTEIPTETGTLISTGVIDASNLTSGEIGGNVDLAGTVVGLMDEAIVDVSGNGGGTAYIGGNSENKQNVPIAQTTIVDQSVNINASSFLDANGGFVEISGADTLDLAPGWGNNIDVSSNTGNSGKVLIDPTDIVIQDGSGTTVNSSPVTATILFDDDITNFLNNSGDLEITTESTGSDAGNITIQGDAYIDWSSGNSLTLNANNDISNSGIIAASSFQDFENIRLVAGNNIQNSAFILSKGNISLNAGNSISNDETLGIIHSSGGNINLNAVNNIKIDGFIQSPNFDYGFEGTALPTLFFTSSSLVSNAGNVTIQANTITNETQNVIRGQNIILEAEQGISFTDDLSINPSFGDLKIDGQINILADSDLNGIGDVTMDVNSTIEARRQDVSVQGASLTIGSIDTRILTSDGGTGASSGDIFLRATEGDVNVIGNSIPDTDGSVSTPEIEPTVLAARVSVGPGALGDANSGNITIISEKGSIDTSRGEVDASNATSGSGIAGNIYMEAEGDIRTAEVETQMGSTNNGTGTAGNISIISRNGSIDTTLGDPARNQRVRVRAHANDGQAGNILLQAEGDIRTGNVGTFISADNNATGTGGNISVISRSGTVNVVAGDNGWSLSSRANNGTSGNIFVDAAGDINLEGDVNTHISLRNNGTGTAGDLSIVSRQGNVTFGAINAEGSPTGIGGDVAIAAPEGFVLGTDAGSFTSITGQDVTISTAGGADNGSIVITHDGGDREIPFVIGDEVATNGILGVITTGEDTLPLGLSIPGSLTQGDISIITTDDDDADPFDQLAEPPVIEEPSELPDIRLDEIQDILREVEENTEVAPVVLYASFIPQAKRLEKEDCSNGENPSEKDCLQDGDSSDTVASESEDEDILELIFIAPNSEVIYEQNLEVTSELFKEHATDFYSDIKNGRLGENNGEKLYKWLLPSSIRSALKKIDTDNQDKNVSIAFVLEPSISYIPLSALVYDPKGCRNNTPCYLVEKYSIALLPNLRLTDTKLRNTSNYGILPLGIEKFDVKRDLNFPKKEVEEVVSIFKEFDASVAKVLVDEYATSFNLQESGLTGNRQFSILHLATHAEYYVGEGRQPQIYLFGNDRLRFQDFDKLKLNQPPLDLLVLTACDTGGSDGSQGIDAGLGFGGVAYKSGVKSVLASSFAVDDITALPTSSSFYTNLLSGMTKAEALRKTQIDMMNGNIAINDTTISIPINNVDERIINISEELGDNSVPNIELPKYWAGYTIIGNPW